TPTHPLSLHDALPISYPKGPAGEFGQVDVWSNMVFKDSKVQDSAKGVLEYFVTPKNYAKYVQELKGRFLPVYKNLLEDPMWKGRSEEHTSELQSRFDL